MLRACGAHRAACVRTVPTPQAAAVARTHVFDAFGSVYSRRLDFMQHLLGAPQGEALSEKEGDEEVDPDFSPLASHTHTHIDGCWEQDHAPRDRPHDFDPDFREAARSAVGCCSQHIGWRCFIGEGPSQYCWSVHKPRSELFEALSQIHFYENERPGGTTSTMKQEEDDAIYAEEEYFCGHRTSDPRG